MSTPRSAPDYVLGHSDSELDRLIAQGAAVDRISEHMLQLAGVTPGMRVLDLGCGAGDLSLTAARLVGPSGAVVGVDAPADAVTLAERRARSMGLPNVRFVTRDVLRLSAADCPAVRLTR